MKNPKKCEVHSHNKVRTLFAQNKVRFARVEQLCCRRIFIKFLSAGADPGTKDNQLHFYLTSKKTFFFFTRLWHNFTVISQVAAP